MINRLVFENLRHRWVRTLLSAVVIGVQVTLLLTIVGLSQGMLNDSASRARGAGADIWLKQANSAAMSMSSAQINEKYVPLVAKQPHVKMALGVLTAQIFGLTSMQGVDFPKFVEMNGGFEYLAGGPLEQPDDIVIDQYYATENKLTVGSKTKLLNHVWTVRGIVREAKLSHILADKTTLQELTSNTGRVGQILVTVDNTDNRQKVIDQLNTLLKGDLHASSIQEVASLFSFDSFPQLRTFIRVVIGLSIAIGFLVVFLSMYTAVIERTREIGILKALGAKPLTIMSILLRESIILALAGSVIGIALSFAARGIIMTVVPASIPVVIVSSWWPRAILIALFGSLLGVMYPGLKAARQDAIEALAYD